MSFIVINIFCFFNKYFADIAFDLYARDAEEKFLFQTDGSNPKAVRIMYSGRDILNLESNIRQPFWQLREPTLTRNYHNFVVNRTTYNQLREQALTKDYPTVCIYV